MLLRFGTENHLSVCDYQEISFVATTLKDSVSGLINVLSDGKTTKLKLLPILSFYGANAAGKSNFIHALEFMVNGIKFSYKQGDSEETAYAPFLLDDKSKDSPSKYDIDFLINGERFHYGYRLDGKKIVEEWLFSFDLDAQRQSRRVLFHRNSAEKEQFYFGKTLKGENRQISRLTRSNSLFLSTAAQNAHAQLQPVYEYLTKKISFRSGDDISSGANIKKYFDISPAAKVWALKFLGQADTGLVDISFKEVPASDGSRKLTDEFLQLIGKHGLEVPSDIFKHNSIRVELVHKGVGKENYKLLLGSESSGTQSLLHLLGPIFEVLNSGGVMVVDELNTTLHPIVCRELIGAFKNENINVASAQLIFSTHDTNLLAGSILRRDEIWFVEKSDEGKSIYYPLSDIKVRSSDNLEKGYLAGRFGAIPFQGIDFAQDEFEGFAQ